MSPSTDEVTLVEACSKRRIGARVPSGDAPNARDCEEEQKVEQLPGEGCQGVHLTLRGAFSARVGRRHQPLAGTFVPSGGSACRTWHSAMLRSYPAAATHTGGKLIAERLRVRRINRRPGQGGNPCSGPRCPRADPAAKADRRNPGLLSHEPPRTTRSHSGRSGDALPSVGAPA